MSEQRTMKDVRRWRYSAAALLGAAIFGLSGGAATYLNLAGDRAIRDSARQGGDAYFKGESQGRLDANTAHAGWEAGAGGLLGLVSLTVYAAGGRKPEELAEEITKQDMPVA